MFLLVLTTACANDSEETLTSIGTEPPQMLPDCLDSPEISKCRDECYAESCETYPGCMDRCADEHRTCAPPGCMTTWCEACDEARDECEAACPCAAETCPIDCEVACAEATECDSTEPSEGCT